MRISHSKPTLTKKDTESIRRVLLSRHLAQGQKVAEFESRMSRYCNVKGAAAVNSGTSALHLALLALGVGPGDEVILPSYVCSAPLNAVHYTGAKPKVVDVEVDTFNIAVSQVKKSINRKTKAVIVPHIFGNPADLKALLRLGVPVIEDCAQSLGSTYQGDKVGGFGVLGVCSFYATKVMTTGEGGMVLTDNLRLLEKIRDLREYDNVPTYKLRFNYKMTDMQAALGISQLSQLAGFIQSRRHIAGKYNAAFGKLPVLLPHSLKESDPIFFRYVIKVKQRRQQLFERLREKGIGVANPVFKPLHRYFHQRNCPVSDELAKQCLSIPIYPGLRGDEIGYIIGSI